jgi:hypothetical protein
MYLVMIREKTLLKVNLFGFVANVAGVKVMCGKEGVKDGSDIVVDGSIDEVRANVTLQVSGTECVAGSLMMACKNRADELLS